MDNKKRMMFVLDEDYYFITTKLLIILKSLKCYKNKFIDYRKFAFIIEFIKDSKGIELYKKSVERIDELTILEREELVNKYYNGNINQSIIKKVLFFLEKKELIRLEKNIKFNCIDVLLIKNKNLEEILSSEVFCGDIENVNEIYVNFNRIKTIKYESFIERIFGDSEVSKWEH